MKEPIYLDYNATTPTDPEVTKAMAPFLADDFGNPASQGHSFGWKASYAVEKARKQLAALIGADATQIVWTSGATESNNMVILGRTWAETFEGKKPHLITTQVEHKCILEAFTQAEKFGAEVTVLPVDSDGRVQPDTLKAAIKPNTVLASFILVNNEIGSINPIKELSAICHEHNILVHTDAAQAVGKIEIDVNDMGIDLMSMSGHKMYGPKGIGALFVKNPKVKLVPLIVGGQQESGLRSGTLNVPGIVGFGKAAELASDHLTEESERLTQLRTLLLDELNRCGCQYKINGSMQHRVAGNISLCFGDIGTDLLTLKLQGIAVSSSSACSSGSVTGSYVLSSLGLSPTEARSTIRIGIGRFTQREDILAAAKIIAAAFGPDDLSQQDQNA